MTTNHHEDFKQSLKRSIEAEKKPLWKIGVESLLVVLFVFVFFRLINPFEQWDFLKSLCGGLWSIFLGVSWYLFRLPQPNWEVRGYWTRWIVARFFIMTSVGALLMLLLCPHFISMEGARSLIPGAHHLSHFYMNLGGYYFCMAMCGLTFSLFSVVGGLWLIRKTWSQTSKKDLSVLVLVVLLADIPFILAQQINGENGMGSLLWIAGTLTGLLLGILIVRSFVMTKSD